jgi:hypothetical protein
MKSSSKFKFSYHSYSSAYELDHSSHVMIVIYELVYSLCVMILTCKILCPIIHTTYYMMSRIRAKLRWRFIVPSGVPKFFTCRSVGSGTRGNLGSFCVRKYGGWVWRNRWIHFPFHGWGVGGRWWQPCLSLVTPHIRLGCRSLNCHMRMLTDQYSVASWPISHLVLAPTIFVVWLSTILCTTILEHVCFT